MTKRISDESGRNAGARNVGRFFLFAIPLVLGLAASVWFGFYAGVHNMAQQTERERKHAAQEERAASVVGAVPRPTQQVKVEVIARSCLTITRADVAADALRIYTRNDCHRTIDYAEWHYVFVSPNGTLLKGGYDNTAHCAAPTFAGESAECVLDKIGFAQDDRTATVRVWTQGLFP